MDIVAVNLNILLFQSI